MLIFCHSLRPFSVSTTLSAGVPAKNSIGPRPCPPHGKRYFDVFFVTFPAWAPERTPLRSHFTCHAHQRKSDAQGYSPMVQRVSRACSASKITHEDGGKDRFRAILLLARFQSAGIQDPARMVSAWNFFSVAPGAPGPPSRRRYPRVIFEAFFAQFAAEVLQVGGSRRPNLDLGACRNGPAPRAWLNAFSGHCGVPGRFLRLQEGLFFDWQDQPTLFEKRQRPNMAKRKIAGSKRQRPRPLALLRRRSAPLDSPATLPRFPAGPTPKRS